MSDEDLTCVVCGHHERDHLHRWLRKNLGHLPKADVQNVCTWRTCSCPKYEGRDD